MQRIFGGRISFGDGLVPTKEGQAAISEELLEREITRGFKFRGMYLTRLRYWAEGLAGEMSRPGRPRSCRLHGPLRQKKTQGAFASRQETATRSLKPAFLTSHLLRLEIRNNFRCFLDFTRSSPRWSLCDPHGSAVIALRAMRDVPTYLWVRLIRSNCENNGNYHVFRPSLRKLARNVGSIGVSLIS